MSFSGMTRLVVLLGVAASLGDMGTAGAQMVSPGVKGKIVVFNPGWKGYGVGSMYRPGGASRAAAKGAAAMLVRSATGLAMQIPHTGTLRYDAKQAKIPAAAITVEDALLIERLAKKGQVTVHL